MVKSDFLRRQLTKLRSKRFAGAPQRKMKPAVMAIERWLMHDTLRYPRSDPSNRERDVVFPMFHDMTSYSPENDNPGLGRLIEDLCVAKDKEEDARTSPWSC